MLLFLSFFLMSTKMDYVPGGIPQAILDGEVITIILQNKGGSPTLKMGDRVLLHSGSGPEEGTPISVVVDPRSGKTLIHCLDGKFIIDQEGQLEKLEMTYRAMTLQGFFGGAELYRLYERGKGFQWVYLNENERNEFLTLPDHRGSASSFAFTGIESIVVVDNVQKEAVIFQPGIGMAKIALDPFGLFDINWHASKINVYSKGFSFSYDNQEYYTVSSNIGHVVCFMVGGQVYRNKAYKNGQNQVQIFSNDFAGEESKMTPLQPFGENGDSIVFIDYDEQQFLELSKEIFLLEMKAYQKE